MRVIIYIIRSVTKIIQTISLTVCSSEAIRMPNNELEICSNSGEPLRRRRQCSRFNGRDNWYLNIPKIREVPGNWIPQNFLSYIGDAELSKKFFLIDIYWEYIIDHVKKVCSMASFIFFWNAVLFKCQPKQSKVRTAANVL